MMEHRVEGAWKQGRGLVNLFIAAAAIACLVAGACNPTTNGVPAGTGGATAGQTDPTAPNDAIQTENRGPKGP